MTWFILKCIYRCVSLSVLDVREWGVCVRRAGSGCWCYTVPESGCTSALGCMQKVTETLIKKKKSLLEANRLLLGSKAQKPVGEGVEVAT